MERVPCIMVSAAHGSTPSKKASWCHVLFVGTDQKFFLRPFPGFIMEKKIGHGKIYFKRQSMFFCGSSTDQVGSTFHQIPVLLQY